MEKCLPEILVVDDRPENIMAMRKMLASVEAEIISASSGQEALALTLEHQFALCLLDVMMPGMDGFETAELMRQSEITEGLPIIFVTAMDKSDQNIFQGYQAGAVDYLYKPVVKEVLLAKVVVFLDLDCRQQELREANQFIAEQNHLLEERAIRDGLTGLYNHAHFQEELHRHFSLAKRHYRELTLLIFDLDYFKDVNDTYGHQMGDHVLKEFALLLADMTRESDLLARYGGEEFVMVLPDTSLAGGVKVAEKIRATAEGYIYIMGKTQVQVTVSIGVSAICPSQKHRQDLIEQADTALYKAKAAGRNRVINCQQTTGCSEIKETEKGNFFQIRAQLLASLEKNRAAALASFEGLVHSRLKDATLLKERNAKAVQLVNLFAKELALPPELTQTFRRSFKLHDLFRLYIDDPTLGKDSTLDDREKQMVMNQPVLMKELTDLFDFFAGERQILLYHHEHYDGSGYPEGLEDEEIPLGARVFGLIDTMVAMTTPSWPHAPVNNENLQDELRSQAGKQSDPALVELALKIISEDNV